MHDSGKFFKEVRASFTGSKPDFIAVLIAAKSTSDLPVVRAIPNVDGLEIEISFANGMQDHVLVTPDNIKFFRDPAPVPFQK